MRPAAGSGISWPGGIGVFELIVRIVGAFFEHGPPRRRIAM